MAIHVLQIDLAAPGLSLVVTPGDPSKGHEYRALKTSEALQANDWQAAVNGGYFLPFSGGSPGGDDYIPQPGQGTDVSGAAIHNGRIVSPIEPDLDRRVNAILCIWGESKVVIRDGQDCGPRVREAMAAGPRLLKDGQRLSYTTFDATYGAARHPRTALGLDARRRLAWLVTVDGRQPGFSDGANLDELTDILISLGARDAINLDGGGSTTMVVESANGHLVLNRPIHTGVPGRERPSANHLGVRARPLSDGARP
jgi:exopolysaccharide biosynthesis protein